MIRLIEEMDKSMAPKEEIEMILRAFENHDLNKDGYLTKEELKTFLQKMGNNKYISVYRIVSLEQFLYTGNVSDEHVSKLFDEADINKDGKIDTEEFIQVLRKNSS